MKIFKFIITTITWIKNAPSRAKPPWMIVVPWKLPSTPSI